MIKVLSIRLSNRQKSKIPEANIQAELYYQLKLIKIKSFLECVKYKNRIKSKFDVAVLDNSGDNIIAIVEIKSWSNKATSMWSRKSQKQFKKYSEYGLPLLYCCGMQEIDLTIDSIKQIRINYINGKITDLYNRVIIGQLSKGSKFN